MTDTFWHNWRMPATIATAGANHGTGANVAARPAAVPGPAPITFSPIFVGIPLCITGYDIIAVRRKSEA